MDKRGDSSRGRVGIVTLPGRFNCGNRLQNYASTWIYEQLGYEVESIVLGDTRIVRYMKQVAKKALGRPTASIEERMLPERLAAFDHFNDLINIRTVCSAGGNWKNEFTFFSVGSDQVWNMEMVGRKSGWYFLQFAEKHQRIALAPSIGLGSLNKKQSFVLERGIDGFNNLSIRESRGAELIKECSGRDAKVICDPTLVVPAKEWRRVANDALVPSGTYVLAFFLGDLKTEANVVLNKLRIQGLSQVIKLGCSTDHDELPAGPAEFISLIDNAAHVVTDSFHAAVFSSILRTPLTIVRREGGANMFSRLETLSRMLDIEEKVYGSPTYDFSHAGEYAGMPDAISRERGKFMAYLEDCLV